ncbi:hypothetical protein, partial [Escherichia coli]|uniref:hypothetical protein n=1 Tax=Escherichia coli TaxID=562 RepID=UPI00215B5F4D
NVLLDLEYTIEQNTPITVRPRGAVTITSFEQGRLSDPEVDAFSYRVSGSGIKYRLYSPSRRGGHHDRGRRRHPLVVWLHGGGEGGLLPQ